MYGLDVTDKKVHFRDDEHREALTTLLYDTGEYHKNRLNAELLSTLYILTSSYDFRKKILPYVKLPGGPGGIEWGELWKEVYSSAEMKLIRLAFNLWNGDDGSYYRVSPLTPMDIITTLDEENFKIAMQAISLRRNEYRVSISNL